MINKVSFMGREECLTGPIKKAQKPVVDYISDGAVLPEIAQKAKTSIEEISSEKLNEAYRAAHGIVIKSDDTDRFLEEFLAEKPQKADLRFIMPGQQV